MPTLADLVNERALMDITDEPIYLEGATCAEHECVRFDVLSASHVTAKVDDMATFVTELWVEGDLARWRCSCDRWTAEQPCAHIVATAIETWRALPREAGGPSEVSKGDVEDLADRHEGDAAAPIANEKRRRERDLGTEDKKGRVA